MNQILNEYLEVQEALANDNLEDVKTPAQDIQKFTFKLSGEEKKTSREISSAAGSLAKSTTLDEARTAFEKLSDPIVKWTKSNKPAEVEVIYCPMKKSSWVQKTGDIKNPFFGKKKISCGQKVS